MNNYICKAKDIKTDEWVSGYYVKKIDPLICCCNYHFILCQEYPNGSDVLNSMPTWHQVKPHTLCRYTGVNDQHGNPIFEHDILKVCLCYSDWSDCNEIFIDSIMFENGCFCFNNVFSSDGYNELSCVYNEITCGDGIYDGCIFEVIGNKFDNTNLMEG